MLVTPAIRSLELMFVVGAGGSARAPILSTGAEGLRTPIGAEDSDHH
jgi:hypothetical protein